MPLSSREPTRSRNDVLSGNCSASAPSSARVSTSSSLGSKSARSDRMTHGIATGTPVALSALIPLSISPSQSLSNPSSTSFRGIQGGTGLTLKRGPPLAHHGAWRRHCGLHPTYAQKQANDCQRSDERGFGHGHFRHLFRDCPANTLDS